MLPWVGSLMLARRIYMATTIGSRRETVSLIGSDIEVD
jgi:hypothetical protein